MFKNLSIRIKIIVGQVFLIAMVSVFIYSYYPQQQEQLAIRSIESKIKSISNMFSIGVGIGMGETDLVAVSEAMEWTHTDSAVVYISVRNDHNQEITSRNLLPENTTPPLSAINKYNERIEVDGVIYYKSHIVYQNTSFGTLVIGYSLKQMNAMIGSLKRTTSYFCLALFTIGVLIAFTMSNMITANILKLDQTVRAISSGAEQVYVTVTSNDEIGKLGRAFNHMLHRLEKSRLEMIRYSEQLKKQNEELNQFSYVVSHDLKAPLRAIFKLSEWIEEDLGSAIPAESKKNMQILRGRVFRLESLINGLLEYSKVGRLEVPVERVDVYSMLKETTDLLNPPAHIKIEIKNDMPVLNTKKYLLQQVFINLIGNAIKYNDKEDGKVIISSQEAGDFHQFTVEDNGMGIAPAYHKKVFEMFQTLESRDKVEGTGIGLAIIKKSVEDIGGTIQLESEENQGARFIFTWPKAA
jgi:signal transduction histidine kinase